MPPKASIARRPLATSLVNNLALAFESFENPNGSKEKSPDARPDPLA